LLTPEQIKQAGELLEELADLDRFIEKARNQFTLLVSAGETRRKVPLHVVESHLAEERAMLMGQIKALGVLI
jgi:hypothetical protein